MNTRIPFWEHGICSGECDKSGKHFKYENDIQSTWKRKLHENDINWKLPNCGLRTINYKMEII